MSRKIAIAAIVSLILAVCIQTSPGAEIWREESFADFADGTFGDAGANTYVSAAGRIQTVNRWDLNDDGFIDIAFANSHGIAEALDMDLYWGNSADFDVRRCTSIPADGSQRSVAADLNADGRMDLVVVNYANGSWTDMPSAIYYGGASGDAPAAGAEPWDMQPFNSRILLPTKAAQNAAVGDLNGDGYPDIVFAQSGGYWEYRHADEFQSPSRIYWGSPDGFSPENFTDLLANGASDVAVADLNADKHLDIVFANRGGKNNDDVDSYIYFGAQDGFDAKRRIGLPTHQVSAVEIADVNNDGAPDLVFANEKGTESVAYLNQGGAFASDRGIGFDTYSAKDCAVADFNGDGFMDVFNSNYQRHNNPITDSYLYFGSADGFSNAARQALPTIGAWGATAVDLNADDRPDLVVSNHKEYYSYEVPSFIYWNDNGELKDSLRTTLYQHGPVGNTVADFNGDGKLEVIFNNWIGRTRGGYEPVFVYLGDEKGQYSTERRMELPCREAYEFAMADLDDDNQVDFIVSNSGEVTRRLNETWIYWNDDNQFSMDDMTGLPSFLTLGVQVADLDRNGYIDLVVSNIRASADDPGSFIYWGEADGYVVTRRTVLRACSRTGAIADLNEDGHLDVIFGSNIQNLDPEKPNLATIFWGDGTRDYGDARRVFIEGTEKAAQPEVADLNKDGHLDLVFGCSGFGVSTKVYWGDGSSEFSIDRRVELEAQRASTLTIADVDTDGWLDLIFPQYLVPGPPVSRTAKTTIWRGGPDGFDPERMFTLYTDSGTGSLVSDFNFDGYPDIFVYCHRIEGDYNRTGAFGDHFTDSFLYWGGPSGFSDDNYLGIPSAGVHDDAGVDLGNIRDRGFDFDYISSPQAFKGRPERLNWTAQTPLGSAVKLQLRVAGSKTGLAKAPWLGSAGEGSYYEQRNSELDLPKGDWIQYRAVLDTVNGARSPILEAVEIAFE